MCPCGKVVQSRTHRVRESEMCKEDVLKEMREIDECDMDEFVHY